MRVLSPVSLLFVAAAAASQAVFSWTNVHIGGGGGFTPGIVFHPKTQGVAYARTDIGGLYRLNSDDSWTPITDSIATDAGWHNWGIDALALDPENDQMVYAAVGMYTNSWDPNNGSIIRSSDGGETWSFTQLPFKVGGNMPGRGMGERLAVDPQNPDIIYFGARSGHGLWKSTDGGVTFSNVTSYTAVGTYAPDPTDTTGYNSDLQGLAWVTFDSTSSTINGATSRIFVGTADNITASVYVSEDAGETWTAVPAQPRTYFPHKGKLQPSEKALYITYSDGTGPYDGTMGAVYRYDISTGAWTDITPVSGSNLYFGFGGCGVDMLNPGTVVVASLNSWWPDAQLFRTNDSGSTWSPIWAWTSYPNQDWYYGLTTSNAPWITAGFISQETTRLGWMIEALEIDPFDSDHWLYGTGLTVYGGHDLTKWDTIHNVSIMSLANGIEEASVQDLTSIPGGTELVVAVGDDDGFTFPTMADLGTSPATNWMAPEWSTATSSDYAGNQISNVVRTGDTSGSNMVAVSTDGGVTWNIDYGSDTTSYGGTVAYSADADIILWSTATTGVLRSQYQSSFTTVSGLPSTAIIASDKRNDTVFYGGYGSTFYQSIDGGSTFTAGGSLGSATAIRDIAAHPTAGGEVYVSTDQGLFHSTDFGASFTQLSGSLTDTYQVSLGVGAGSSSWYLYAFGTGIAGNNLYASADGGASWTDVQGTQGFGAIDGCQLAGSGNEPGLVYVGTNGRGVFYAQGTVTGGSPTTSSVSSGSSTTTASQISSAKTMTASTTIVSTPSTLTTVSSHTTTKTSSSSVASPTSTATGQAQHYAQCGGDGWTGPTQCVAPYTRTFQNDYYSQCL